MTALSPTDAAAVNCYEKESWLLAMKLSSAVGDTSLGFNDPLWTSQTLLNQTSPGVDVGNAKYAPFLSLPFTHIRMCIGNPSSNCIDHSFDSEWANATSLFSAGFQSQQLDQVSILAAFQPPAGTYSSCFNSPGFNVQCGSNAARWGYCSSCKGQSCDAPNSAIGIGLDDLDGQSEQVRAQVGQAYLPSSCTSSPADRNVWLYVAGKVVAGGGDLIVLTGGLGLTVNAEAGCAQDLQDSIAQAIAETVAQAASVGSELVQVTVTCQEGGRRLQVSSASSTVTMEATYQIPLDAEAQETMDVPETRESIANTPTSEWIPQQIRSQR